MTKKKYNIVLNAKINDGDMAEFCIFQEYL